MKILVNTKIIKALSPCKDRLDNWNKNYVSFSGDVTEFLELDKITYGDKLWVALRLMPREFAVIFALDCSFAAYAAAGDAAGYANDAANAATSIAAAYADYAGDANVAAAYADYASSASDAVAYAHSASYASASAANAAAYASADADAVCIKEYENQIEVLKYLIKGEK